MSHLIGGDTELAWVAVKALLLYLTAVIGFRLGERRTLAEMSPFDFVAAVAVGAIVGRVPNSKATSYLAGAATLVTVLIAHRVIMRLRHFPSVAHLVEHSSRVLVQWKDPRRRVTAVRAHAPGPLRATAPTRPRRPKQVEVNHA